MLFLTNINLNKNELQNAVIQNLVADPQNGRPGQIYYNSQAKTLKQFDGTTWNVVGKELTPATYAALGGVIVDQDTLTVDSTGKVAVKVPTDNNFSNTLKNKLDGIEAGARVNIIEGVSVDGVELTPDANKVVDIDLSDYADDDAVVHKTGAELIEGQKTFSGIMKFGTSTSNTYVQVSSATGSNRNELFIANPNTEQQHKVAITGITSVEDDTDAANKQYVDDAIAGVPQGTVTSVRVQATSPVQSSTNTAQTDTLNTTISLADNYGDTKNPYASKTANYVLAAPNGSNGVPTFRKLVAADIPDLSSTYLPKSGGTMSGAIAMGSNGITGLATPTNDADAATKKYVDDAINGLPEPMIFKGTLGTAFSLSGVWKNSSSLNPKSLAIIFPGNC